MKFSPFIYFLLVNVIFPRIITTPQTLLEKAIKNVRDKTKPSRISAGKTWWQLFTTSEHSALQEGRFRFFGPRFFERRDVAHGDFTVGDSTRPNRATSQGRDSGRASGWSRNSHTGLIDRQENISRSDRLNERSYPASKVEYGRFPQALHQNAVLLSSSNKTSNGKFSHLSFFGNTTASSTVSTQSSWGLPALKPLSFPQTETVAPSTVPTRSVSSRYVPDVSDMRCFPNHIFHDCTQLCYNQANEHDVRQELFLLGEHGPSLDSGTISELTRCLADCRLEYIETAIPGCVTNGGYIVPGAPINENIYPDGVRKPGTFSYYFNRRIHRFFENQFLRQSLALLVAASVFSGLVIVCLNQSEAFVDYFPEVDSLIVNSRIAEIVHWILEQVRRATTSSEEDREAFLKATSDAVDVLAGEARRTSDAFSSESEVSNV